MVKTESQLEIYKIILGNKTIRQIISEKVAGRVALDSDTEYFNYLFKLLISKLTQNAAWTSDKTKVGLSLFANAEEEINTILSNHSANYCIEGFIDGGPYDKIKTIAQTDNVSRREQLGKDKMVTDRFYIYLYLPLGSKVGLLLIEKKGNLKISSAIQFLITELLKTNRSKVKFERFVPQELIEEYKNGSIVDTLTFTDYMTTSVIDGEGENNVEKQYGVTVKITPPNEDKGAFDNVRNMIDSLRQAAMQLGVITKPLSEFSVKKGTLKKGSKSYSFSIGDDLKIKPIILIPDEFQDRESGILRRVEIKKMCDELLMQIHDEIYLV